MAEQVTKPILLDETGQVMVEKLQAIADAIKQGGQGGGIPEAPIDGNTYGRKDGAWEKIQAIAGEAIIEVDELPSEDIKRVFYLVVPESAIYVHIGGEWIRIASKGNAYSSIKRIAQYLYDTTYDETVTDEEAEAYLKEHYDGVGGLCTSMSGGGYGVHCLDWYLTHLAEFRVYTPAGGQREVGSHSMGGNIPGITDDFVRSGKFSERFKYLPYTVVDGINEMGVFASVNVVSSIDGVRTTGTHPDKPDMCALRIVRHILDHYKTAKDAVYDIAENWNVYMPTGAVNEEFHWIVGDNMGRYILEFKDNHAVIIDKSGEKFSWMTNFRLDGVSYDDNGYAIPETVEPHGQGLERYNLVADYRDYKITMENIIYLANELRFSRAYTESIDTDPDLPLRKTEFTGIDDLKVTSPVEDFRRVWGVARQMYEDPEKREKGNTWQTQHLAIYDLEKKSLTLFIQENFEKSYSFILGGQIDADDKTTLVFNLVASEEEEFEYDVADNVQPELNAQIVSQGTARFFKFVVPMTGAKRLMKAASKASGEDNAVTVNQYVLAPILMCNTRNNRVSLAAQIFEEDMTITGVVEYRDGAFYQGAVGAGDTFVSYTQDQYMTEEQQNLARKNMDVYHTDKEYRNIYAEYNGNPDDYPDKVSSRGGRIYALVQQQTFPKEYQFERIILDGNDNVYWDYNRDCIGAKIRESGDILRVFFALQDNAEANASELEGDPIVFPRAGVWFFVNEWPGDVSADTFRNVIVKVPTKYLPDFPSQEDFDKLVMMLKEESERAINAEKGLQANVDEAKAAIAKISDEVNVINKDLRAEIDRSIVADKTLEESQRLMSESLANESKRAQEAENALKEAVNVAAEAVKREEERAQAAEAALRQADLALSAELQEEKARALESESGILNRLEWGTF